MKILGKSICAMLICSLVVNGLAPAHATSTSELVSDTVCIDGVEYEINIDTEGNVIFKGEQDGICAEMIVASNGIAEVEIDDGGADIEEYTLDIENLDKDNVDVQVYQDDELVEEYNEYEEIIEDSYSSQFAIPIEIVFIGALLIAFIAYEALILIEHVVYILCKDFYKAISKANEKQKERYQSSYFPAHIDTKNHDTYISSKAISLTKAAARLASNQNIYTPSSNNAKKAIRTAGYIPYGQEIHNGTNMKGHWVYWHYHPGKTNSKGNTVKALGAHALYGSPQYVK